MLVLHHLQISQSERVVWLLEELGLEYKLVIHVRDPVISPDSLKKVPGNHTGKSPFLDDQDKGVKLAESAAIVDYIIHTYGNGRLSVAPGAKNYADYLYWFHYANGTLQPACLVSMFVTGAGGPQDNAMYQFSRSRMDAAWQLLDDRLRDNKYLAGDEFTAADIMTVYCITTQRYFGPQDNLGAYPNLLRWVKECSERPAAKRADEKADPLMKRFNEAESPKNIFEAGGAPSDVWKKTS